MNYNILAYGIYLVIMVFIILYVGRLFHSNGRVFILSLFGHDAHRTDHLNNLLLLAYYLFNIGYTFIKLQYWQPVANAGEVVASTSSNLSVLILILAVTHYCNMGIVYLLSKKNSFFHHNKTI